MKNMKNITTNLGTIILFLGIFGSVFCAYSIGDLGYYGRNWPLTIGVFCGGVFSSFTLTIILYAISDILAYLEIIKNVISSQKS